MAGLTAEFSREDVETLIESIGDWEMVGNQDFHILSFIKNIPMPPEDNEEAYEAVSQVKDHFKKREKEIMKSREVRQEKSILLKAKLILVRQEIGTKQLFDMASAIDTTAPVKREVVEEAPTPRRSKSRGNSEDFRKRLELAEFFIKDLGVQSHYEKFLAEKAVEVTESSENTETEE